MNKILMSIKPQWCQKIFNGEKTIEVRRTRPKLEPPFEVLVYETKGQFIKSVKGACTTYGYGRGKVIGSFVCDRVRLCIPFGLKGHLLSQEVYREMCLTKEQLDKYGGLKTLYGWHITEPKLFDKPKELSEFYIPCKWYEKGNGCPEDCGFFKLDGCTIDRTDDFCEGKRPFTRPPQSWCYIEED